jgi:hypothetical protein
MLAQMRFLAPLAAAALTLAGCATTDSQYPNGTLPTHGSTLTFASIDALTEASDLVFIGTVIDVIESGFDPAPETEDLLGHQFLAAIVRIDELLYGTATDTTVAVRWYGYEVGSDGTKGPQWIVDGEHPPKVGETNLWFIKTGLPGGYNARTGGEGRVDINDQDGSLTLTGSYDSGAEREIEAVDMSTLRGLLQGLSG